jgi:GntR family transcriptional regulator, transcriptional repressor for pyruvate dehydrogenase complex
LKYDTVEEDPQAMELEFPNLRQGKTLMVEHAVAALKEYILGGRLSPGTELPPESEMAREMGISKFSLREALRVLEVIGLIEISQGKRTRVASHSIDPLVSLFEIALKRSMASHLLLIEARKSIEGHVARFAALRAEPSHIEAMRRTIEDVKNNRDDLAICANRDIEFHNILVDASGNMVFRIMLAPIMELLRDQRREQIRVRGVQSVIDYHSRILSAVVERNPDKAEEYMALHLVQAEQDIREAQKSMPPRPHSPPPADDQGEKPTFSRIRP